MDPKQQEISERDQLWASMRSLLPMIEQLVDGQYDGSDRQKQVITLLARIIVSELDFRKRYAEPE
jgi:hypothetical protein